MDGPWFRHATRNSPARFPSRSVAKALKLVELSGFASSGNRAPVRVEAMDLARFGRGINHFVGGIGVLAE